jgi:hypothetical protein
VTEDGPRDELQAMVVPCQFCGDAVECIAGAEPERPLCPACRREMAEEAAHA